MSSQPQRRGRPVTEPNSLPRLRERRADLVGELGGKRAGAHARRVRLDDAEHVVEKLRPDAGARSGGAREAIRRRDVRIRAVVDVEQRTLRAFEQQRLAARARFLQQRRDVGDHRLQLGGERQRLVERPRERHRVALEILREHEVVEFEERRELRGEPVRVEEILQPDRAPGDLVLVRGTDAASGGADLRIAHRAFARLVERDVIGEHQRTGGRDLEPRTHR